MAGAWPPRVGEGKTIIGMVHLRPLPGTPIGGGTLDEVVGQAVADAKALEEGGVDAVLVQNRGDRAFPAGEAPPDVVAAMGAVANEVVRSTSLPVGVHVLRNDTRASLAVARVSGARFVRAAVLTGSSPSAQGILEGRPHAILRYRHAIDAEDIAIFADVASMHNKTPAPQAPEAASDAVFFGAADAVIVARPATDETIALVDAVRSQIEAPILIGGHADHENVSRLLDHADGAIVGGAFEKNARQAGVDASLVRSFMRRARSG